MVKLVLTVLGSINVMKSTQKCPRMPLDLHASATRLQALFRSSGSIEDCGIETPQQLNGESAWIWSPRQTMLYFPVGSINMSTAMVVVVSDGGHASITPPTVENKKSFTIPVQYRTETYNLTYNHF